MEDKTIVELYWARNEDAISQSEQKYGRYCFTIAYNILSNKEDSEECVNDTWVGAWNSMPPHYPERLSTFLGKITRNLSLKTWEKKHAAKRGGGELPAVLDELDECIPSGRNVEEEVDGHLLTEAIDRFLDGLSQDEQIVFVRRYWYMDPIAAISTGFGFSESKVRTMLHRTRRKLQEYLEKEGYHL